jgi:hypothetical protein
MVSGCVMMKRLDWNTRRDLLHSIVNKYVAQAQETADALAFLVECLEPQEPVMSLEEAKAALRAVYRERDMPEEIIERLLPGDNTPTETTHNDT